MRRSIVLLRAVNVGDSALRMATFAQALADAGCASVRTVGASGNAVVETASSLQGATLEAKVEAALARRAGLRTEAFAREGEEWDRLIRDNPYAAEAHDDPAHLLVVVLKSRPAQDAWTRLAEAVVGRERTAPGERHAYIVYPDGIGRSKLTAARIDRALGVPGTGRNWNTVLSLQQKLAD